MNVQITENLDVDVASERWLCHHCHADLGSARENYKEGCRIRARDPEEIWQPLVDEPVTFSFDRDWCRIVEFACPGCGWLIEVEALPPGHPITHDIQLDLDSLRARVSAREGGAD